MIEEIQIRVVPKVASSEANIIKYCSCEKGIDQRSINAIRIIKRSIDARQRQVFVNLTVRIYINEKPDDLAYVPTAYPNVENAKQVIVVGAGPAGYFAALRLIELGLKPIVLERGKDVHERKKDLARIKSSQAVDSESNYCFGEGGAGAYSDGKLYTRSKKRGNVDKILNVFCQFGASTAILYDAHPHIGTDKLPQVIENMRLQIINSGGEVHFETKMTQLVVANSRVEGVIANGKEFYGPVILATGHSARDVYRYLYDAGIHLEAKGIAVGVRLEHPSHLIDQIQYHNRDGRGQYLPAAEYSFVTQVDGRGVYSFCMCPGGFVIPAATGPEQIVVNGMSPSNRGGQWSNSGMVVEIRPEDVQKLSSDNPIYHNEKDSDHGNALDVMDFQEKLEKICWQQGNMSQTAPAQRMSDFVNKRLSYDIPKTSYAPGVVSSPLHFWLPDIISNRLKEGFKTFGKQRHGFLTNDATVIGVETRTSSPVRITRNPDTMQHIEIEGLFPCGEGAGYAGGIVSAGVDGERSAEMASIFLQSAL